MSAKTPIIYLARHGETEWTLSGQHTGLTDLPLTENGETEGLLLRARLAGIKPEKVYTSPLIRASRTCELAGFKDIAEVDPDLVEWDYGDYEGLRSSEIDQISPGWNLFRDGVPNGETVAQITARADRVVARLRTATGDQLLFSSGHFTRVLAARWIGVEIHPYCNGYLLSTASLSAVGYKNSFDRPVIRLWNDVHHLEG